MPVETPFRPSRECEDAPVNNKELSAQELRAPAIQQMIALGQMSRGFVHDFRNILAVISAGLNLAKRHESEPDLSDSFLTGAQEGVARGMRMTKRLLDFASGHDCDIHPENVNNALRQLETLLGYAAGAETRIDLELDPDVPDFDFDPPQFNSAIMNLVVNARDAMPDGGVIQITTELVSWTAQPGQHVGSFVRVRVRDNGLGMSASVVQRIFDPFFTTKAEKGRSGEAQVGHISGECDRIPISAKSCSPVMIAAFGDPGRNAPRPFRLKPNMIQEVKNCWVP